MAATGLAKQLEALGNETRLAILQLLAKAGKKGINVGEINKVMEIPPSTLSHHIAKLANCGLLRQERKGRAILCTARSDQMDALVMFLAENCCGEDSEIWA